MTPIRALLFDLDGTLIDTAPDLCGTIIDMQRAKQVSETPFKAMQPFASGGARALLKIGFGLTPEHADFENHRQEFLQRYEARIAQESQVYEGIEQLLSFIETKQLLWGVVTNKPYYLAEKLLNKLNYLTRCAVLVGGDTTDKPKPSPLPCLFAAQHIQCPPAQCLMIGDDQRDILSAHHAGMRAVAVRYGYIASDITTWNADYVVDHPRDIEQLISQQLG